MTKEEIIELANKVKLPHEYVNGEPMWLDKLEAFAKMVAEHEREKCAKIAEWHKQMAFDIRARGQE